MKRTRMIMSAIACISAAVLVCAACATEEVPHGHSHTWSAWSVSDTDKPTDKAAGKAKRTCSGEGDCDASASEREYGLPMLTSADYVVTDNTATCTAVGTAKYTYQKNGINVSFTAATPIEPEAHEWGKYMSDGPEGHYRVCARDKNHVSSKEPHDAAETDNTCSKCGYSGVVATEMSSETGETTVTVDGGKTLKINFTAQNEGYYLFTYTGGSPIRVSWSCGKDVLEEETILNGENFTVKISDTDRVAVILIASGSQTEFTVTLSQKYSRENPDEGWSDFH